MDLLHSLRQQIVSQIPELTKKDNLFKETSRFEVQNTDNVKHIVAYLVWLLLTLPKTIATCGVGGKKYF